jgi:hypothetical protein
MSQFLKIARLNDEQVARVRALEEALERHIMAFEPGPNIASLSEEQIAAVKALEESLGVTLLVYEA